MNATTTQPKTIFYKATERGHADHGWLNAWHSFSFAGYYNPAQMHFGVLRVLNDDTVAPGMGFGTHPHDNMEIVTIPLEGALEHKDSMGNQGVIHRGEIQVMSAGTGVRHSEYNASKTEPVKLLQIWVFPNQKNVTPRYDQIAFDEKQGHNQFQQIVSPDASDAGSWVHQNAWFNLGKFDNATNANYSIKRTGNGVYVFVINGSATVNGQALGKRDAIGVWDTDSISVQSTNDGTEILLMDVPMN